MLMDYAQYSRALRAVGMSVKRSRPGSMIDDNCWCRTCEQITRQERRVIRTGAEGVREASSLSFCTVHKSTRGI